jgi:hypothetical protein
LEPGARLDQIRFSQDNITGIEDDVDTRAL